MLRHFWKVPRINPLSYHVDSENFTTEKASSISIRKFVFFVSPSSAAIPKQFPYRVTYCDSVFTQPLFSQRAKQEVGEETLTIYEA